MERIIECTDRIRKKTLILLDYDGTLTPIVQNPGEAILSEQTRALLSRISIKDGMMLGVISGRSLEDIKTLVGLSGIYYGGNHGLELEYPNGKTETLAEPQIPRKILEYEGKLKKTLSEFNGIHLENKKYSLTIHYRSLPREDEGAFRKKMGELAQTIDSEFRMGQNKKTYEIIPANANKGLIVSKIASLHPDFQPIYVGDDNTDEDAFMALGESGITVSVGERQSAAKYYAADTNEVFKLLTLLAA
jgi:trehalose 6-phosphate phosphatase